jgi:hypothetical protein
VLIFAKVCTNAKWAFAADGGNARELLAPGRVREIIPRRGGGLGIVGTVDIFSAYAHQCSR